VSGAVRGERRRLRVCVRGACDGACAQRLPLRLEAVTPDSPLTRYSRLILLDSFCLPQKILI
jgi:hypothetical protein